MKDQQAQERALRTIRDEIAERVAATSRGERSSLLDAYHHIGIALVALESAGLFAEMAERVAEDESKRITDGAECLAAKGAL